MIANKANCFLLAPIVAKILCCRGSAAKIVAESGYIVIKLRDFRLKINDF